MPAKRTITYGILTLWIALLLGCNTPPDPKYLKDGKQYGEVKGLFRQCWWNFYERGVSFSDGGFWEEAVSDFKEAIIQRDIDQRRARTYGMHFVDYFPHRELGVAYYNLGRYTDSEIELEKSLSQTDNGKTKFYINKARKALLKASKSDTSPPVISVSPVSGREITNSFTMKIEGEVEDDSFAEQIAINENPLFVELSAKKLPFSEEVKLKNGLNEIKIKTADLMGRVSEKKVRVIADFEGPLVNISNYVDGQYVAERNVVLKGVIADATGIINLKINDKVFKYNNQEKAEFEVPFGLTEGNNRIPITATDAAGNTTRGELNIIHAPGSAREKNIPTHQYKKPEPVRLAFQGSGILDIGRHRLFAAALPGDKATDLKLNLKDIIDSQTVFFDTIYIDGSVTCSSEVKSVRINGSPLYVIPGRTIYFNRIIELQEGENKVAIEAQDAGGNIVSKTVSIIRQVPKVHQAGSRMSLAILPFEIKGETSTVSTVVYDNIISSFFDLNRFNIVSRGDELEAALRELKLSATDLVDKSKAVQVGKLVAAEGILTGSIRETKNSIEIYARFINTATSALFEAKDVYGQNKALPQVKYLTDGLALKFKHSFPLLDGLVIKVSGNSVYADFGSIHHIKKDMKFIVFREGEPVIHPVTGKALGSETEELGVAKVINVFEEMSLGKLEADFDPNKIKVKDHIITK